MQQQEVAMTSVVQSQVFLTRVRVGLIVWIAQSVTALTLALAVERRARKAARNLRELDDRMLADIGLPRAEIETAVRCGRRAVAGMDGM
jgi:uncharacterized protein YjiS (DUF1127 family)